MPKTIKLTKKNTSTLDKHSKSKKSKKKESISVNDYVIAIPTYKRSK